MRSLLALALAGLLAAPALAQATEEQAVAVVLETVLPASSASPLTADDALTALRERLSLENAEREALDGFSLGVQGNLALIRQEGEGNVGLIEQTGEGNLAALLQIGFGNATAVEQMGRGNVFGLQIVGSGNQLGTPTEPGVLQFGNHNVYLLEYTGSDRLLPPTQQFGDGNQLVQTGVTDLPFGVEQRGGATMIIEHRP
jgi:minor curlin subunit